MTRKLRRSKMHEFFSQIEPSLIGMEACGSAHYLARELKALGHEVLLMPPAYAKPYVKRGKNDAVDADACCEAMSRPGMRFVPVKSAEQQATLMLHKTRELLVKQRTMSVNALRGHLSEFGIIAAKGIGRIDELLDLVESDTTLPNAARASAKVLAQALEGLDKAIDDRQDYCFGDRSQRAGPERVQVGTRFHRLARPHAEAKLKRWQAGARGHHQAGEPIHQETARVGGDLAAKRSWQAQRRLARLDCWPAGEEAGAAGYGGAGQQARPDPLGDDEDRGKFPHRDVREGVRKPLFAARSVR